MHSLYNINQMEPTSLQKVVQRIRQHGAPLKIEELCLDEIKLILFTQQISALLQKCQRIQYLSLCSCQLSSLIHFPTLPALTQLELSNNNLQSQHLEQLSKFPRLYHLSIDSNLIKDFGWIRHLKRTRLRQINIQGNPITQEPQYREKVYKGLGADLEIIDHIDREGNFIDDSESSVEEQEEHECRAGESEEGRNNSESEDVEDSLNKKIKGQEKKEDS